MKSRVLTQSHRAPRKEDSVKTVYNKAKAAYNKDNKTG